MIDPTWLKLHPRVEFEPINWKRMLAYVTGSVDQELLAQK